MRVGQNLVGSRLAGTQPGASVREAQGEVEEGKVCSTLKTTHPEARGLRAHPTREQQAPAYDAQQGTEP
eukprot:6181077-Alexandrium_andersonii.AAC.1